MSWYGAPAKTIKARRPHRCRVCDQRIAVGETCDTWTGLEPGTGWWTVWVHPECHEICKEWDDMDWECLFPGDTDRPKKTDANTIKKDEGQTAQAEGTQVTA